MAKVIALDANVLLLLVVGLTDPRFISGHKRLSAYTKNDFKTLASIIENYDEAVVIPNALSETSNLVEWMREPARTQVSAQLQRLMRNTREIFIESKTACERLEFHRLGLTDAVLLEIAKQDIFLLSADGPLYRAALDAGYKAGNFMEVTEAARA